MKETIRSLNMYSDTHAHPTSVEEAFAFCRKIALGHYENFTVGSILLPKEALPHIYNLYAYCRLSDDISDEMHDPKLSMDFFGIWRKELQSCYDGTPKHPVFVALQNTIRTYNLPIEPFNDLIYAFEMDQTVTRYPTFEKLLFYCKHSANPVGRLFLMIFGYRDEERQFLSDATCTALQLANFWQDIPIDFQKGRIYIPQEDMARFGYSETSLSNHEYNEAFVHLMEFQVSRAKELFRKGLPLSQSLSGRIRLDVDCFSRGGMKILELIKKIDYNVLRHRPVLTKWDKASIFMTSALRLLF
ncbi:MAG: squalene synthase HpnC [Chlamydiota bacterium]|nr:squalene synthase HpnC [Chlamydiota bacterium]